MQSTGKEKFTVYVYIKTKVYTPKEAQLWVIDDDSEHIVDDPDKNDVAPPKEEEVVEKE